MNDQQVVVVGAGPGGISAALALKDVGVRSLLVDRAEQVGSSWRGRYDRLRLNTCRPFSHLPDRPFAKGTPMFPTRDQVVAHLDQHAHEGGFELELGTRVDRISRTDGHWVVETSAGEREAPQVVVATGYEHTPLIPDWPGRDGFGGSLVHSSQYRNPEPYTGARRCSWSARAAPAWRSPTTWRRAGRARSGCRPGPRRTSSSARGPAGSRET
jgi:cation diffusion facilitator CzcD-associated flavoprotein CzcO